MPGGAVMPIPLPPAAMPLFTGLGTMLEEYRICIKPGAVPFSVTVAKWIPIPLREVVKDELDKLEMEGVIRRVYKPTPWCAGLMVGPKDSWRTPLMC